MSATINMERVMEAAANDENMGFCLACGEEQGGLEPDARQVECECCHKCRVYGAEEVLLMLG